MRTTLNPLAARISVHVHDGEVTLTGQVREPTTATIARDLARSQPGVAAVFNELRLEPGTSDAVTATSDVTETDSAEDPRQQTAHVMDEWWTARRDDHTTDTPRMPPAP